MNSDYITKFDSEQEPGFVNQPKLCRKRHALYVCVTMTTTLDSFLLESTAPWLCQ